VLGDCIASSTFHKALNTPVPDDLGVFIAFWKVKPVSD
jgi:hypothetical protein